MLKYAWLLSFIRFPLLVLAALLLSGLLSAIGIHVNLPYSPDLSTIYFTIVNIISFYLLLHILKKGNLSLKEMIGYKKAYFLKDVLFAFLWLFVLYIPFVLTIFGTMFIMYGTDFIYQFEAVVSLLFPFINAPVEELMYRGYAQRAFIHSYPRISLGIIIPSLGFAIQHTVLAVSISGAMVYLAAFFVWGIGSGIIYYKQQRLLPLILCHFIVNISTGIIPIIFMLNGVYA